MSKTLAAAIKSGTTPTPAPTPAPPSIIKQVVTIEGVKYLQLYRRLENGMFQPAMVPVLQANGTYQMTANKLFSRADIQAQADAIAADLAQIDAAP